MHCLFTSVLPAPDSPETTRLWWRFSFFICWYAASAMLNVCAGRSGWPGWNFLHVAISSGSYSFAMYLNGLTDTRIGPTKV